MIRFRRPVIACSQEPESWYLSNLVLISLRLAREGATRISPTAWP